MSQSLEQQERAESGVAVAERDLPPEPPKKGPPLTVVADGTSVEGRLAVTGDLRVDGRVEGAALTAGASCEISRGGTVVVEQARAASLVVHGALRADEVVARTVRVMAGGAVHARVVAAEAVDVETGGVLDAAIEIGKGD